MNDDALRRRAGKRARKVDISEVERLPPEETRHLLQELLLYQAELEMQNDDLRRSQEELAAMRARYFDLYARAPMGYCTLNTSHQILEANLTLAPMLGLEPRKLLRQSWLNFVHPEDRGIFVKNRQRLTGMSWPWTTSLASQNSRLCWK